MVASFIGGIGSLLALVLFSPLIARLTLAFGPAEKPLSPSSGWSSLHPSRVKIFGRVARGAFGMGLAFLGTDPFSAQVRVPFASVLSRTPWPAVWI